MVTIHCNLVDNKMLGFHDSNFRLVVYSNDIRSIPEFLREKNNKNPNLETDFNRKRIGLWIYNEKNITFCNTR